MENRGYRAAITEYIRSQARPYDKFSHQPRLYHLATQLAGKQSYDDDVLFAAAWLHDLGVFIGHRPEAPEALAKWDHISYAIGQAPPLLKQFGFPSDKIPAVTETIRTHLPSSQPTSFEGILLRDADILEQLGAIGILRTVSKIGRDTRFIRFSDALALLRRNAEELPKKLQLKSARKLARPRVKLLRGFLDCALTEADSVEL